MAHSDVENHQPEHASEIQKTVRLCDYLLKLASLRTKLIRNIAEYEKVLWISSIPHERECFAQAWGRDEERDSDEWLEVETKREPELPSVPSPCKDWVNSETLRNKDDSPELLPKITRQIQNPDWSEGSDEPETIAHTERLEDYPEVQQVWDRYLEDKWLPWTEEHNKWEKVHEIYSELFAIYQAQLRLGEEYELVIGLGLLTWQTPADQRVRRHVVVANAVLEFEARLGKFTLRPHTDGAKLRPELDMLDIEEQPIHAEEIAKEGLTAAEDNPWEKGCVETVLQSLVHSISSQSDYNDSLETKNVHASAKPVIEYAPALILRKRSTKGLSEVLKRIKEQIEKGETIPSEFADLAEIDTKSDRELTDEPNNRNATFDGEIFFPKPSNEEQRQIVDKMRATGGVLVQGPPGTGKSHTIANLICHLLATGQRTLITAKTPRALQVLKELVPKELRPLCINLLGSGLEERGSLESSVNGILRKNEAWNDDCAYRESEHLEQQMRKLREEKAKIDRRLHDIRESETHTQSIAEGRYRGTAPRIAEAVNRSRSEYEWFKDSVPLETTCQVSTNDLQAVLAALRQFTSEKRMELSLTWPNVVLSLEDFARLVRSEASAPVATSTSDRGATKKENTRYIEVEKRFIDSPTTSDMRAITSLQNAFLVFRDARKRLLTSRYSWMNAALHDILGGNSSLWRELLRVTQDVITSIEEYVARADETRVELPNNTDIRALYEDAHKLKEHMENGGKLGWGIFRPQSVKERLHVIKSVRINGHSCATIEDLSTLIVALYVRIECEKGWSFWKGRNEQAQGPYTLQRTVFKSLSDALESVLALKGLITQCREALKQCPDMSEPIWGDDSQINEFVSSCRDELARIRKQCATYLAQRASYVRDKLTRMRKQHAACLAQKASNFRRESVRICKRLAIAKIQNIETQISRMATNGDAHPVTKDLLNAIRSRDVDAFARCENTIRDLDEQRRQLEELERNLSKLRDFLPRFAKDLEQTYNEPYWENRIQHIDDAWHWAQARYWIEEYIRQEDSPALDKRAKQIEDEINSVITKLASLHAWSFCFSRLEKDHRRHMVAWQQSMRKLGKGAGKHAPRHRREAQEHLNACREAVPAWVMPLHRVWDTVDPASGMFDVIIVDEASQCGFEAFPLLYLGKKIVIVGDDKQISPDAVGQDRNAVHHLIEKFLHDFRFKSSFDIESSLFDHGKLRYGTQCVKLREHFRCMPEIIRFSNDLCYSGTPLIPLRQYGLNRLPPLEHVFVNGGYREGQGNRTINRPEAEAIVERISRMCDDRKYDGKSMGVVVLQGEAQAALIEKLLLEKLGAAEIERRRLVCGNPYSFQGDERDIMFLSLVAASNERIGPFTKAADERRFNVAASRARDMMILFHSITCDDLSDTDFRRRLLDFFQNTRPQQIAGIKRDELERRAAQDNRHVVNPPAPFESWFEVDVALELLRKGFTVLSQYEVAGKRIDLVVEGGKARLAVECDGDHWHGPDKYESDMQRQRQLERCGWGFFRVRESAFYTNKEDALAGLWGMLEERGISSNSQRADLSRVDLEENSWRASDVGADAEVEEVDNEENDSLDGVESAFIPSDRRAEEVTAEEIREAILQTLSKCPNHSCTLQSITARVLKEVGVLTRGKPREAFQRRTMRCVSTLEKDGRIETYKATNRRLRLIPTRNSLPLTAISRKDRG